jgi:hypothetical protein
MGVRRDYISKNKLNTNYSTVFLLPILGYKEEFFTEEFISAYIDENENKKLVLCFNNSLTNEFREMILELQTNENFNSIDYDDDDKEIVLTFTIPKSRDIDYNLFKSGRYTKISNEYKEILLDFHNRKSGAGKYITMIDALMPDHLAKKYRADKMGVSPNDLPGSEVMSIPDMDRELYIKTNNLVKLKGDICEGR